jgi:CubicO group peptidase (beta-lactamase class C family)
MYHIGSEILGVIVARVTGMTFEQFLRERIFEPMGMKDTGFHVPAEKLNRLPTSYKSNPETGEIIVHDDPGKSRWGNPPSFQSGGGGLVSTVDDYLAFCKMMLNKGRHKSEQILTKESVELMTTDHLTSEQKDEARIFFDADSSWGFGVGVSTQKEKNKKNPRRFGWDGGIGTSGYSNPKEDMVGILMTQLLMDSPKSPDIFRDFWTSVHRVISE